MGVADKIQIPIGQPIVDVLDMLDEAEHPMEVACYRLLLRLGGQAMRLDRPARKRLGKVMQRLAFRLDY